MHSLERAVYSYICAKDTNRPHLIDQAFEPDAVLEHVDVGGDAGTPALTQGRDAIADRLVSRFGQDHENAYTFCVGQPPSAAALTYSCKWMVAMSDKTTRQVKIECGRYDWHFNLQTGLARRLTITVAHRETLPAERLPEVMNWVSSVNHPWCARQALASKGMHLPGIEPVISYIGA